MRGRARLAAWAVGLTVLRGVGVPAEVCPEVDRAGLASAAVDGARWLERAQHPDGTFTYRHHRDDGDLGGYHVVRHAGAAMALHQLGAHGDEGALAAADRADGWMRGRLVSRDDWQALADPGRNAYLGSTALMAAGLTLRFSSTGDLRDVELLRRLGRFVLTMQEPNGGFLDEYDVSTGRPVPDVRSTFSTGEATWVLTLLDASFPDDGWHHAAQLGVHYLAVVRDEVEPQWFTPRPDQWAAYALATARWRLDDDEIAYARRLAERFSVELRVESQRESNAAARFVRGGRIVPAGLGVEVEGMAQLWALSLRDERLAPDRTAMAERARCGAGLLVKRQEPDGPPLVRGAWYHHDVTQMDDQQHALSGLLAVAGMRD